MRKRLVALGLAVTTAAWGHGRRAVRVEVPFETLKGHQLILVHAKVAGKDATMIFDSGADFTMVDAEFAGFSDQQVKSVAGAKALQAGSWSGAVAEGSLCLADHCFAKREIGVVLRGSVSKESASRRIDGIIGQDVLREFDEVSIDYRRCVVTLVKGEDNAGVR